MLAGDGAEASGLAAGRALVLEHRGAAALEAELDRLAEEGEGRRQQQLDPDHCLAHVELGLAYLVV